MLFGKSKNIKLFHKDVGCDENNPTYIGCFSDNEKRDLFHGFAMPGNDQSTCNEACKKFRYFALQKKPGSSDLQCFCGNAYGTDQREVCTGKRGKICTYQYIRQKDHECGMVKSKSNENWKVDTSNGNHRRAWRNAVFRTCAKGGNIIVYQRTKKHLSVTTFFIPSN